ncbi:ABC transporter permease [Metabacillus malikii]|uniref:Transport permease protein n=1 Tax=Metabacillus malikii TaxID=1504265 RepID=A0ABT9ZBZ1_9BACI|nr:ABC transporter permease [Metabacillus malikii]MDQ0229771.1 ABC-2 type transport system permease protein [Metabacillus malikii]
MLTVCKSMMLMSIRDKITVFYAILFPIGLMIGLGLYIGSKEYNPMLMTGVITISMIFWGLQGTAFQIHWQRNRGVFKLVKLTPISLLLFILAFSFARTLIGTVINVIILLIGIGFFEIPLSFTDFTMMFLFTIVGSLIFSTLGILLANITKNEGQMNMFATLVNIPMIFGVEAFFSTNSLPDWLIVMGKFFPAAYFVEGFHIVLGLSNANIFVQLLFLIGFLVITILITTITFSYEEEQSFLSYKKA